MTETMAQASSNGEQPAREPAHVTQPLSPNPPYLREFSEELLNVRVLDPLTAYQVKDQPGIKPTVFVADTLLVRGRHPDTIANLEQVAGEAGFQLVWDPRNEKDIALLRRAKLTDEQRERLLDSWVSRVKIVPV